MCLKYLININQVPNNYLSIVKIIFLYSLGSAFDFETQEE